MSQHRFREKTRRKWDSVFDRKDAFYTPVLGQQELEEAKHKQHLPMRCSPGLAVAEKEAWVNEGLPPGVGGIRTLDQWFG